VLRLCLGLFAVAALVAGCGEDDGGAAGGAAIDVVATTTQAADLARNVGGDRAGVVGLLAANTDPHGYEVRPRDVQSLAEADLVVRSGGDLDEWLGEAIEGAGGEAPVLTLIDRVRARSGEGHGHDEEEPAAEDEHADEDDHGDDVDPHWWQDPRNAELAVTAIRDAMTDADPEGAETYRANADRYLQRIRRLDAAVARCIEEIPVEQRKLVTTHDALAYYAERYGLDVIGTVIPSRSTQGQASAGETAELVNTIREARAKAIFPESSVNAKVEQAIAREAGARIGAELWADTLGPAGSAGDTYLKSIAANTRAIVDGLTGGAVNCPA
jgi:ABC-type Zn uptake system ZnuABC Zn-binding protein ZnuA